MVVEYKCIECNWEMPEGYESMICKCGGDMRPTHLFGLTGTRDNFGIKNAFRDEKTGKEVDNFKSWERAGYKQPLDVIKNDKVRDGIKTKLEKIKRKGRGRTMSVEALPA